MIAYNNQGIKLLPYDAPIPLYDPKYSLHKTSVGRPRMARLRFAVRTIFGLPVI